MKNMLYILIIDIVHFVVSFILLVIAIRSFLKTRVTAMFYLILGFALITFGHLLSDIYFFNDSNMNKIFSEISDIAGLIALIIAVEKSAD